MVRGVWLLGFFGSAKLEQALCRPSHKGSGRRPGSFGQGAHAATPRPVAVSASLKGASMRFGVWDPHGNPGRRPKNRAVVVAVLLSRDCLGDKERWAQMVKSVHFFESAVDNRAAMKSAATLSKACVCSVCNRKFASERALAARTQRVHGYRTEWSKRVDDSGVCPVCKATFHTRIRVLNHVRSSACRNKVGDPPELPEEIIERYRRADAAEIRTARPDGRSAPAARRSATSHDGKMHPAGVARL